MLVRQKVSERRRGTERPQRFGLPSSVDVSCFTCFAGQLYTRGFGWDSPEDYWYFNVLGLYGLLFCAARVK